MYLTCGAAEESWRSMKMYGEHYRNRREKQHQMFIKTLLIKDWKGMQTSSIHYIVERKSPDIRKIRGVHKLGYSSTEYKIASFIRTISVDMFPSPSYQVVLTNPVLHSCWWTRASWNNVIHTFAQISDFFVLPHLKLHAYRDTNLTYNNSFYKCILLPNDRRLDLNESFAFDQKLWIHSTLNNAMRSFAHIFS